MSYVCKQFKEGFQLHLGNLCRDLLALVTLTPNFKVEGVVSDHTFNFEKFAHVLREENDIVLFFVLLLAWGKSRTFFL